MAHVTDEVRPPLRAEMPAYYRALPFANGLPSWEPANAAWHGGNEPWPPPRQPATEDQLTEWADGDLKDPDYHPMAAFVDGVCVGASATISFHVTVPGGSTLPMAGVTGTGVIATHRRRGYLRQMMQAMFDDALQRGEPLTMLSASEGSIYGRFGFSPATYRARLEITRPDVVFLPAPADTGTLELVGAEQARVAWPVVHEHVRSARVGELAPLPGHWDGLSDKADGANGPLRYLVHRDAGGGIDGVANYRLPWSATEANAGTLVVEALEATTPEAYRELWRLLLDFDLTRTVVAPGRPREEPLTWMLSNPRAVRITRQSDNLWSRLLDVPAALAGRGYLLDDCLVLRIADDSMCPANVGSWELDTRDDAPVCSATDRAPDATLSIQALSSLFFGGVSAHDLAYAGHIEYGEPETVTRLARLFQIDPKPHNSFGF
jgi:predicted acetyltransferase